MRFGPCFPAFVDLLTRSIGTHNITQKNWAWFFRMAFTSKSSRTLNKIFLKSGLKSLNKGNF